MRGLGTMINVGTVLVGAGIGVSAGSRIPERVRETVVQVLALATLSIGLRDVLGTQNVVFPIAGMALGAVLGELARIEDGLRVLGERIRRLLRADSSSGFVEGFVVASLLYCVGPMTLLGGIQDGSGDFPQIYVVKAALDGTMAIVLAARYGAGVAVSAVSVFVVQGSLVALGGVLSDALNDRMMTELFAGGGFAIMAIGLNLLGVARIRLGSLLPGLALTPVLVAIFAVP